MSKVVAKPAPSNGQLQEEKDQTAEKDLQALYKKGLLAKHDAIAPSGSGVRSTSAQHARASASSTHKGGLQLGLKSDKDMEAMRDLESLHKVCVWGGRKGGDGE
jgi:hypothetical protein